jgi:hypothetical protein
MLKCTRDDVSVQASMAWLQTAISMLKRHRILLIRYSMGIKSSFKKLFSFALPILDMPANVPVNSTVLS